MDAGEVTRRVLDMEPTQRHFQEALDSFFAAAERDGKTSVEVNSGDLHRSLGGYPGRNHRMPVCCKVLAENMQHARDTVVESPPSGQGASLTIRYALPR